MAPRRVGSWSSQTNPFDVMLRWGPPQGVNPWGAAVGPAGLGSALAQQTVRMANTGAYPYLGLNATTAKARYGANAALGAAQQQRLAQERQALAGERTGYWNALSGQNIGQMNAQAAIEQALAQAMGVGRQAQAQERLARAQELGAYYNALGGQNAAQAQAQAAQNAAWANALSGQRVGIAGAQANQNSALANALAQIQQAKLQGGYGLGIAQTQALANLADQAYRARSLAKMLGVFANLYNPTAGFLTDYGAGVVPTPVTNFQPGA